MTTTVAINKYRTTATIVGVVYVAGFVLGIGGNMLVKAVLGATDHLSTVSASSLMLAAGAVLWLIPAAGDVAHGVLMFPVLKQHSERIAFGYLAARTVDAVFIAVSVLFTLIQIPLAGEYLKAAAPDSFYLQALSTVSLKANLYAYDFGMIAVGLSGLMLNYLLYRARLVPGWIAVWGLVGYAIIFCGMVSEVLGTELGLISSIPGGLWEVFIGVWLIVKGFNSFVPVPGTSNTSYLAEPLVPALDLEPAKG